MEFDRIELAAFGFDIACLVFQLHGLPEVEKADALTRFCDAFNKRVDLAFDQEAA